MRRRAFITLLGGAVTWPLAARAQTERMRRICRAHLPLAADDPEAKARLAAFQQALQELGWTEGRNVQIDTRFAGGDGECAPPQGLGRPHYHAVAEERRCAQQQKLRADVADGSGASNWWPFATFLLYPAERPKGPGPQFHRKQKARHAIGHTMRTSSAQG
jgi:hypothetical protein